MKEYQQCFKYDKLLNLIASQLRIFFFIISTAALLTLSVSAEIQNGGFENGDYSGWTAMGTAWGSAPQTDTWPSSGFEGTYLANSFFAGESETGTLQSDNFSLQSGFCVDFLIGGWRSVNVPAESNWNYVVLCRASDDAELDRVYAPNITGAMTARKLLPGTTNELDVYIKVVDDGTGTGGYRWLSVDSFKLNSPVPEAPAGVTATDGSTDDRVVVTWYSDIEADKYKVYRNTVDNTNSAIDISSELGDVTQFTDNTIADNTDYYYWVQAGNSYGWSPFSDYDKGNSSSSKIILYDGTLGNSMVNQDWFFGSSPISSDSFQFYSNNWSVLDTMTTLTDAAGLFSKVRLTFWPYSYIHEHDKMPELNRTPGFRVNFGVQVDAEDHSSPGSHSNGDGIADRSGFSVIILSSDSRGAEIAFWEDEIWTQMDNILPLFTHSTNSDSVSYITTNAVTDYSVEFIYENYYVYADESFLYSGIVKNYAGWNGGTFPDNYPYGEQNFIFFGDDSTTTRTRGKISYVNIERLIPEPGMFIGLILAGIAILRKRV